MKRMKPITETLNSARLHLTTLVNQAVTTGHELTIHNLRYGKRGFEVHSTVSTVKGAA